jgi:hypothetical protein
MGMEPGTIPSPAKKGEPLALPKVESLRKGSADGIKSISNSLAA